MIAALDLVAYFQHALDHHWGYIYGMTHEMWSEAKQKAYQHDYADDPDRANSCQYGGRWAGHWVTDCSGLFKWAFTMLGGSIAHGSNSIWDKYCSAKGEIRRGSRTDGQKLWPGTAVFTSSGEKHNHIGLYIGLGMVIEAQGAKTGVVTSSIQDKRWTHWGELKSVYYEQEEDPKMEKAKVVLPSGASGETVNMREGSSRDAGIICRVPVGSTIDVIRDAGAWCFIQYQGKQGWMMSNYIEYDGQDGENANADTITQEQKDQIDQALRAIEEATETIGRIIGRG